MSILEGIADAFFPPRCLLCDAVLHEKGPVPVCPCCRSQLATIQPPLCVSCGIPFDARNGEDHLCGECILNPKAFSRARALGRYEDALLSAIHTFKYRGRPDLGRALGQVLAAQVSHVLDFSTYTLIMPVPLHTRRLRERTFNQARVLAGAIARRYAVPLDYLSLKRHVYTKPQITLGKKDRRANVAGAFRVVRPEKVAGQRILLVDDVYTTGSTLDECARILMKSGAGGVDVLTLARAV